MKSKLLSIDGEVQYLFYGKTLYFENRDYYQNKKKAFTLKDTGDGVVFKDHFTKGELKLDYCQLEAIRLLSDLTQEKINVKVYKEEK